jgi:hypothetical protein
MNRWRRQVRELLEFMDKGDLENRIAKLFRQIDVDESGTSHRKDFN